jgi:hypothetical protein
MTDRGRACGDAQFAEDGADVKFDGVLADAERVRNLAIRKSGGHLLEDFLLAHGQRFDEIRYLVAPC